MNEARNRERLSMNRMQDFVIKIYRKNDEPEFIKSIILDISEAGVKGTVDERLDLKEGDRIAGVIEGEEFRIKLKYEGTVSWVQIDQGQTTFGGEFAEDLLLPDVLIARMMAVA